MEHVAVSDWSSAPSAPSRTSPPFVPDVPFDFGPSGLISADSVGSGIFGPLVPLCFWTGPFSPGSAGSRLFGPLVPHASDSLW